MLFEELAIEDIFISSADLSEDAVLCRKDTLNTAVPYGNFTGGYDFENESDYYLTPIRWNTSYIKSSHFDPKEQVRRISARVKGRYVP
ncbi:MAG: hypothetical protein V4644_01700 [Patescibacteria group bacterium]